MALHLIQDPPAEAEANMEKDERIAREVCAGQAPPSLRLYGWVRPAVSIGHRQKIEELPSEWRQSGREIVRRPTGGGAVLHDADGLTYAVVLPRSSWTGRLKPIEIPVWIHRQLNEQLTREGLQGLACSSGGSECASPFCFESPVFGDLLYRNRKVAGSALRVWRGGLLIQGSIQGLPVMREGIAGCLETICERFLAQAAR